ncbi:MAG TPA: CopG family antitoxin [Geobacteraceae bacterium]
MRGRPAGSGKPDPMLQQVGVRLPTDLLALLNSEARAKNIPISTLIRMILSERYNGAGS